MSETFDLIIKASFAVMVADFLYRAFTRSAPLLPRALALIGALAVLYTLAPAAVQARGGIDEAAAIAFCYASMVLGMMAEYVYAQAERGNRRLEFDWLTFLMPIFVSPIVFIPLLTLTADVAAGGALTRAKVMIYLVAFQNGFFWKSFFEQRRKQATSASSTP